MRFGCHISIAGGIPKAVERAIAKGCDCFQIFSRSPRSFVGRPLEPGEAEAFRQARAASGMAPAVVHIPYLINPASPDDAFWEACVEAFREDLSRADELGAEYLVIHPGSHKGAGLEAGIARVGLALKRVHDGYRGGTAVLLENTAGSGNTVGRTFEELERIAEASSVGGRLGLCLDTAHAFAAGYQVSSEEGLGAMMGEVERRFGKGALAVVHANDSAAPAGSNKDRHADIGKGYIGEDGFEVILSNAALKRLPFILETPVKKDPDDDIRNLRAIRRVAERVKGRK